ncbi:YbhB/YbcL family Raf kinase inhibitor-like protein [Patescibacteria group bacterium]
MQLTSQNFTPEQVIPKGLTCDGEDKSPQLSWSSFPANTKSFALSCIDPDALGGNWAHWLIINMPISVTSLEQGAVLETRGIEVENDFSKKEYGGPCPPSGEHRYVFTIYALDVPTLMGITKDGFASHVEQHALDKAELVGRYSRSI